MKLILSLLFCGLLLSGCHRTPEPAVQRNADSLQAELENQANAIEAMANNAADQNAAEAMANVTDETENATANATAAADARGGNLN